MKRNPFCEPRRLPRAAALLCSLPLVGSLFAQESKLSGPVSGYVFEGSARALRLVIGVPGASYLGPAIRSGIDFASVSPDGRLAVIQSEGNLAVAGLGAPDREASAVQAAAAASRAAWADDSSAVAVWIESSRSLLLWRTGEPAWQALEVSAGEWQAMAVASRGEAVLVGLAADGAAALYRLAPGAGSAALARLESIAAIAIGASEAYIADRTRNEILAMHDWRGSATLSLLANETKGIADPVGLGLTADSRTLMVAGAKDRSVTLIDIASASPVARLEADVEPATMQLMASGERGGQRIFLLNRPDDSAEALQVVTASGEPGVFFVPRPVETVSLNSVEE